MIVIIIMMALGIGIGYLLRHKRYIATMRLLLTPSIWLLLFLLGIEVGSNERIIKALPSLGLDALIIAITAIFGSIGASWLLWKYTTRNK